MTVSTGLPIDLFTDGGYGNFRRLRVDQGQTSFFAGREYRTFKELSLAASPASYTVKVVVNRDTILLGLTLAIDLGTVRLTSIAGPATEGGSFSEVLPIINKNRMSEAPVIAPVNVITAGGTVTGGTTFDIVRLKVPTTAGGGSASTVGGLQSDERGVAIGTYYFKFESLGTDPVTGVFSAFWEERALPGAIPGPIR